MTFRGVLLQLNEPKSCFHVVAPDAELLLPHDASSITYKTPLLTKWSDQKLVIIDTISHKMLQVARLATITFQEEEKSVFLCSSSQSMYELSETLKVGTISQTNQNDNLKVTKPIMTNYKPMTTQMNTLSHMSTMMSSSSTRKSNPLTRIVSNDSTDANLPMRSCYCFHFRSGFEYKLFAQTLTAYTRLQEYALLQSSLMMEMEISREYKKKNVEENMQAETNRAQQRHVEVQTKTKDEQEKEKKLQKPINDPTPTTCVIATSPSMMFCVLCRRQRKPNAPEYSKHPFVLKDGNGNMVHICKICLQRVLKQRLAMQASTSKGSQDNICGLCARTIEEMSAKSVKACAHEVCPRVYCTPCIHKLIGKAQIDKVWQTKNWLCPNCSTDNDIVSAAEIEDDAGSIPVDIVIAEFRQKKRKRCKKMEETSAADEKGSELMTPACLSPEMKLIDYVATYFKFLLKRERKDKFEESENVCFCCKDGGDLIECDWKGMNGTFERCPKVYHEDCLGYKVPEDKTWICPRHRCQDCGIIAQYACRFCVTSYCEIHLSKDVKRLGHATQDIPTSTYVMCPRCNQLAHDALEQKKISLNLHAKLFRRRAANRS